MLRTIEPSRRAVSVCLVMWALCLCSACTVDVTEVSCEYAVQAEPAAVWDALRNGIGSEYSLRDLPESSGMGFRVMLLGEEMPLYAESVLALGVGHEAQVSVYQTNPTTLVVASTDLQLERLNTICRTVVEALARAGISVKAKSY